MYEHYSISGIVSELYYYCMYLLLYLLGMIGYRVRLTVCPKGGPDMFPSLFLPGLSLSRFLTFIVYLYKGYIL